MSFLYFLENMRNAFMDALFLLITMLGEETVFLVIALVFVWCVNKREGFYILISGLLGTLINQTLKLLCKIPRPWVKDPTFKPVGDAIEEATGYSFPSGHTQNATTTFGAIGRFNSKRASAVAICTALIVLVGFSRMYLGVHTPADVLTSLGIGIALVFLLHPLFATEERFEKSMPYIVVVSVVASAAFLLFVLLTPEENHDYHNYHSALKNACTLLGCTVALVPMYLLDRKYIKFDTKASWYVQVIKLVLGFGLVLAVKSGLSSPLVALFGNEFVARAVRYFLVVIMAGVVWPFCFRYLVKIKIPALDRFGERVKGFFKKEKREEA